MIQTALTDCQRSSHAHRGAVSDRERDPRHVCSGAGPVSAGQERSVLDALELWLRAKLGPIGPKSKLAEAIRYAPPRWDGLTRFVDDGQIEVDSNVIERAI